MERAVGVCRQRAREHDERVLLLRQAPVVAEVQLFDRGVLLLQELGHSAHLRSFEVVVFQSELAEGWKQFRLRREQIHQRAQVLWVRVEGRVQAQVRHTKHSCGIDGQRLQVGERGKRGSTEAGSFSSGLPAAVRLNQRKHVPSITPETSPPATSFARLSMSYVSGK